MFEVRHKVSQTRVWSEMQGFLDPRLKWSGKLLSLTLDLEGRVTQTSVGREAELLRLVSNVSLLRPASEVSMLLEMRGPCFSSKCDRRIEVRLAPRTCPWWFLDSLQRYRKTVPIHRIGMNLEKWYWYRGLVQIEKNDIDTRDQYKHRKKNTVLKTIYVKISNSSQPIYE